MHTVYGHVALYTCISLYNNNNNNNNFIDIALKSNDCQKRYLITKWNIKNLNNDYKISTIYNII